jgi:beta-glucosidase
MADTAEPLAYRDESLPITQRVEDLLDRMTLKEKVGQLVGTWAGDLDATKDLDDVESEIVDHGVGAVASFGWAGAHDSRLDDIVETVNRLQEVARSETRLGIPLLFNVDAVHGHAYVAEGTAFPNGLGMAATRNESLAESTAATTADEVRATGAHQNYSPTCDVARDPRWGRTFETFGESPYLCGTLAAAKVRGYQGDGVDESSVIATAKHFPAYSEPVRGEDASPAEVSEYALRNVFVPPFVEALRAGVESVMPAYNATNGEPAHGSKSVLTEYLRDDLGFDGTIVSDWNGVRMLHNDHRVTADHRGSVQRTREAGLDLASVDAVEHAERYRSLVEDGALPESLVDESVRRVLTQKFKLGLFEDPFVDPETADATVGADEHRRQSLVAARQSTTTSSSPGRTPMTRSNSSVGGAFPPQRERTSSLFGTPSNRCRRGPSPTNAGRTPPNGRTSMPRRPPRRTSTWPSSRSVRTGTSTSSGRTRSAGPKPMSSPTARSSSSPRHNATSSKRSPGRGLPSLEFSSRAARSR